jgi:predicted PurR-regulated permease PerM
MPFLQTSQDRASFLILLLSAGILVALVPFVSGLMGAAVLYVIFVRPYRGLARKVKPGFAAAMILIAAVLIVALPVVWLVGLLIAQAPDALSRLQSSSLFETIGQMRIGRLQVGAEIAKVFAFVGGATSAILNLVIAMFGFYYLLQSGGTLWTNFRDYIPFSPHTADSLRDSFFSVTEAMLLGTVLVAVVQGAIVGAGFFLTGLPNPVFWGTVTAFASIIPVLGSGLVWLPAVLILLVQRDYGEAAIMLVMGGGIASNIDNLLRPLVYRHISNIHPMITIVGAFAGIRYFGLIGLLLGPLAIAYLFELLRFYRQDYSFPASVLTLPG